MQLKQLNADFLDTVNHPCTIIIDNKPVINDEAIDVVHKTKQKGKIKIVTISSKGKGGRGKHREHKRQNLSMSNLLYQFKSEAKTG